MANQKISQLDPIGTIDENQDSFVVVDYSENLTKRTNLANIGVKVLAANTTDNLTEGDTNLYYTDARFDSRLATKTTDDLTEGTNQYYTDAKVESVLTAQSVTKQGNTFNGAEQLVQLDASAKLPAVDGSNLTNLPIPPSTGGNLYLFYNY